MQPKPELIRLLSDSGSYRTGYLKLSSFLSQLSKSHHFLRLFRVARHFVPSPLTARVRYVPLLVFPANNKASRTGGF